jgi:hypothetical protein
MSAQGMLAAINNARSKAMPATTDRPGAAQWQLLEAATPLAVTSFRAAAASGSTDAMVASLQQQMQPIEPTPLTLTQASVRGSCCWCCCLRGGVQDWLLTPTHCTRAR